jgi:hypothetical protein
MPNPAAIFGATTGEDVFAALPGEEADTLTDRPKHVFIHPRIFTQANGPKYMRSKQLAWALIQQLMAHVAVVAPVVAVLYVDMKSRSQSAV